MNSVCFSTQEETEANRQDWRPERGSQDPARYLQEQAVLPLARAKGWTTEGSGEQGEEWNGTRGGEIGPGCCSVYNHWDLEQRNDNETCV